VSMPDGTSAAFYRREPDQFRDLLRRTIEIHERLYREWPSLSRRYRDALADVTSPETWASTFESHPGGGR
jgi:galactofuranosylgalactofuranosylrhamnosyl-N-acetylglucosaminyl-diphospho-decaprenol beta-1,5/1,6-galactofuranosyltransferase